MLDKYNKTNILYEIQSCVYYEKRAYCRASWTENVLRYDMNIPSPRSVFGISTSKNNSGCYGINSE